MSDETFRTFVVYVEDKPGVLNRVVSLFRRRNLNIHSLNVGTTHESGVSRMTVVIDSTPDGAKRIEANLYKLVNVLWVDDITDLPSVDIVLALIKVRCPAERRDEVLQIAEVFGARKVDMSIDTITLEITDSEAKVEALLGTLEPIGIEETVQTGTVSMMRGAVTPRPGHPTVKASPVRAAE